LADCLDAAATPLWHLHDHGAAAGALPDLAGLRQMLLTIPEQLPRHARDLAGRAAGRAAAWLARRAMHAVAVHGDYWPANILVGDDLRPRGLVDWEWFRPRGLPGYDALYLLVTTLAHARGAPLARVMRQIWIEEERGTAFRGVHRRIARRTGFSAGDMGCLGLVLWLAVIRRTVIDTRSPGDHWLPAFLADTAPAVEAFLRTREAAPAGDAVA
jgi:aminoglycoside phosphotransferase (APT) family kinase protein